MLLLSLPDLSLQAKRNAAPSSRPSTSPPRPARQPTLPVRLTHFPELRRLVRAVAFLCAVATVVRREHLSTVWRCSMPTDHQRPTLPRAVASFHSCSREQAS